MRVRLSAVSMLVSVAGSLSFLTWVLGTDSTCATTHSASELSGWNG